MPSRICASAPLVGETGISGATVVGLGMGSVHGTVQRPASACVQMRGAAVSEMRLVLVVSA